MISHNTYRLTVIAMLGALAVIGRIAFANIPNVQPVTVIVIMAGLFLGAGPAIMLAIVITFVTNMLLGMGIWSVWQVVCWGMIGGLSGLFSHLLLRVNVIFLIFYSVLCGYGYGLLISIPTFQITGDFWPYYLAGLPFDTYHAIGNAFFMALLYKPLSYLLEKYNEKYLRK
ncbi:ECF transporter S component [Aciduricibacillus chroicocephali]|uniref:ECF transporter S component n=1 Tax=Aciduricibacillus chroicocephali TaxID=3054939 RepID=A0ABY9KRM8_9BACI|nr:ECF transporter S component [Bacillaceae bacterium 44XB]